jgi:hypothetical protein
MNLDYSNAQRGDIVQGYYQMSWENVLRKGLSTTYDVNPATMDDGDALKKESLQDTMVMAIATEKQVKLFRAMPKMVAGSNVEQYSKVKATGNAQFYVAGGLPEVVADKHSREMELVKFIGVVGQVDGVTKAISNNNHLLVQAIAHEERLKTIEMMTSINRFLTRSKSKVAEVQWDNLYEQAKRKWDYPSQSVIDLRGRYLTPEVWNEASEIIEAIGKVSGEPLELWLGTKQKKNMIDGLLKQKRFIVNGEDLLKVKTPLRTFENDQSESGTINTDIFMNADSYVNGGLMLNTGNTAVIASSQKSPNAPNSGTVTITTPTNDSGYVLDPGTFEYLLILVNDYGTSAGYETGNIAVTSGKKVVFAVTEPSPVSGQAATGIQVWRRPASSNDVRDYRFVDSFSLSETIQDTGEFIPYVVDEFGKLHDVGRGFMWQPNLMQTGGYHQLLDIMKEPLGKVTDADRWLQKTYATPILKNANRFVEIRNMGPLLWE